MGLAEVLNQYLEFFQDPESSFNCCESNSKDFLKSVDMVYPLLGNYGNAAVESFLRDAVDDILRDAVDDIRCKIRMHNYNRDHEAARSMFEKAVVTADAVLEAAKSALVKIEARKNIQVEGEQVEFESKGQDGLGNDIEEEFGEGAADFGAEMVDGAAVAAPADQFSGDLDIAMRESAAAAAVQEGAHIQEAILRSKIEAAQQQVLVVLRVTKRNADVLDALLKDECLQRVRAQVEEAGCEVLPDWASGAIVFVPLTQKEVTEACVELRAHHIVITQENQPHVEKALSSIPKKRHPLVQRADPKYFDAAASGVVASDRNSSARRNLTYTPTVENWDSPIDFDWYIERTFVRCPLPQADEVSRGVKSEPWGGFVDEQPKKFLRLSK
jgi:hypothetical protein